MHFILCWCFRAMTFSVGRFPTECEAAGHTSITVLYEMNAGQHWYDNYFVPNCYKTLPGGYDLAEGPTAPVMVFLLHVLHSFVWFMLYELCL